MSHQPIVVSGIQPTGNLHLGNYLGAVKNWLDLQNSGTYDIYYFIADLHSLTGKLSAAELHAQRLVTIAELLALGIDPSRVTLFVQSDIPAHTELAWILNCVTPFAELERMTQFKDKMLTQKENINTGLFTYPVLMAADIIMYHGTLVPAGLDQVQHVETTRVISRAFNKKFGDYFPETKPLLTSIPKVMSLLEPTKKMSKSLGADHCIELADEPETILKKLKKAVTATTGGEQKPGVENLLTLLKELGDLATYQTFMTAEKDGTIRYGDLKTTLAEIIANRFADFRTKRQTLLEHPDQLATALERGTKKAREVSTKTMNEVRRLVGIHS